MKLVELIPYIGMVLTWIAGYWTSGRFESRKKKTTLKTDEAKAFVSEIDTYQELSLKFQQQLVTLNLKHIDNQDRITGLIIQNNEYISLIRTLKEENVLLITKLEELNVKIDTLTKELNKLKR